MQPLTQSSVEYDIAEAIFAAFPFVTLIAHAPQHSPQVCHLPVHYNRPDNSFDCHVANANPIATLLDDKSAQVQLIFQAEHGYVSPTWSEDIRVPTWDYCAVHVYAKAQVITDSTAKKASMARQVGAFESHWHIDQLNQASQERLFSAITLLKLDICRCEYRYKLSQAKSEKAKAALLEHFNRSDNTALVKRYRQLWQA